MVSQGRQLDGRPHAIATDVGIRMDFLNSQHAKTQPTSRHTISVSQSEASRWWCNWASATAAVAAAGWFSSTARGVAGELASAIKTSLSDTSTEKVSGDQVNYFNEKPTTTAARLNGIRGRKLRPLIRRGGDHQHEALLGSRQLRDVVVRMGTADVLLHGAKAFLLEAVRSVLCGPVQSLRPRAPR